MKFRRKGRHFQDHFNQFMLKTMIEFVIYIILKLLLHNPFASHGDKLCTNNYDNYCQDSFGGGHHTSWYCFL